jgi:hypothetical protein
LLPACEAEVKAKKTPEIEQLAKVLDRACWPHFIKCKMTGLTLETCTHQWTVTEKPQTFVCGKDTKVTDISPNPPAGFPKVPNGHENAVVCPLAKKTPGGHEPTMRPSNATITEPPARRDTEWKYKSAQGTELTKLLTFFDFAVNDGTGQIDVSVQGEEWESRLKRLKAAAGELLFIYDMKAKCETDAVTGTTVVSMSTVRDRDPIIMKVGADDVKRKLGAGDGPVLSKVCLARCVASRLFASGPGRAVRCEVYGKGDGYKTIEVPIQTLRDLFNFSSTTTPVQGAIHIGEVRTSGVVSNGGQFLFAGPRVRRRARARRRGRHSRVLRAVQPQHVP